MNLGKHMNHVLEVNVEGAYALLERGVTFAGLYRHLVKTGLDKHLRVDVGIRFCFHQGLKLDDLMGDTWAGI